MYFEEYIKMKTRYVKYKQVYLRNQQPIYQVDIILNGGSIRINYERALQHLNTISQDTISQDKCTVLQEIHMFKHYITKCLIDTYEKPNPLKLPKGIIADQNEMDKLNNTRQTLLDKQRNQTNDKQPGIETGIQQITAKLTQLSEKVYIKKRAYLYKYNYNKTHALNGATTKMIQTINSIYTYITNIKRLPSETHECATTDYHVMYNDPTATTDYHVMYNITNTKINTNTLKLRKFKKCFTHRNECEAAGYMYDVIFDLCDNVADTVEQTAEKTELQKQLVFDFIETFELTIYYYVMSDGKFIPAGKKIFQPNKHLEYANKLACELKQCIIIQQADEKAKYQSYIKTKYTKDDQDDTKLKILQFMWSENDAHTESSLITLFESSEARPIGSQIDTTNKLLLGTYNLNKHTYNQYKGITMKQIIGTCIENLKKWKYRQPVCATDLQ